MDLPAALVDSVDVREVICREVGQVAGDLPLRTFELAFSDPSDEVVNQIRGSLKAPMSADGPETVFARKSSTALRKLDRLPMDHRLRYRSLMMLVEPSVDALDRSFEAYKAFQESVLVDGVEYVVVCDVHGFYQHVRHRDLFDEIVALSGESLVAELLENFLAAVMREDRGLPQLHGASDLLSELVIDAPFRRLLRSGLEIDRFNDDFRVGCRSYSEALHAIEQITSELSLYGLSLNERKTLVLKRETYEAWLTAPDERWASISDEVDVGEIATVTLYGELIELDLDGGRADSLERAAHAALAAWADAQSTDLGGLERRIFTELALKALWVLSELDVVADTSHLERLWALEPQVSPNICRYLRALGSSNAGDVEALVVRLAADAGTSANAWQASWLMSALAGLDRLGGACEDWVRSSADVDCDTLVGVACVVAASQHWLSAAEIAKRFDAVGAGAKIEIAAATAFAADRASHRALKSIRGHGFQFHRIIENNFEALRVL